MKIYRNRKVTCSEVPEIDSKYDYGKLDDRFAFSFEEIDPELYLHTTLEPAYIYLEDEYIIGDGAGMAYDIVIAVPRDEDHWQMKGDIERSLEEHIQEVTDGTDYTYSISEVKSNAYPRYADIPDDVFENSVFYSATIDIVPMESVAWDGTYRIGAWDEEIDELPF